jgi:hypothetical protein
MEGPREIAVNRIDLQNSPCPRSVGVNHEVVEDYVAHLQTGGKFPPVDLFTEDHKTYWIGDGWHRVRAVIQASGQDAGNLPDEVTISADVEKGSLRDCLLRAVGANADHGFQRSSADKRRAVQLLLADKEWAEKSDHWIAEKVKVSPQTVNNIRKELAPTIQNGQSDKRIGKDGRTIRTRNIGQKKPATPAVKSKDHSKPEPARSSQVQEKALDRASVRELEEQEVDDRREEQGEAAEETRPALAPAPQECEHVVDMIQMGFAYRLENGMADLRVSNGREMTSVRELNFCPVCGEAVRRMQMEQEQKYGGYEAKVSAPAGA